MVHGIAPCTSDPDDFDDSAGIGAQTELEIADCVHSLSLKVKIDGGTYSKWLKTI
jgi:hypothetical protein